LNDARGRGGCRRWERWDAPQLGGRVASDRPAAIAGPHRSFDGLRVGSGCGGDFEWDLGRGCYRPPSPQPLLGCLAEVVPGLGCLSRSLARRPAAAAAAHGAMHGLFRRRRRRLAGAAARGPRWPLAPDLRVVQAPSLLGGLDRWTEFGSGGRSQFFEELWRSMLRASSLWSKVLLEPCDRSLELPGPQRAARRLRGFGQQQRGAAASGGAPDEWGAGPCAEDGVRCRSRRRPASGKRRG